MQLHRRITGAVLIAIAAPTLHAHANENTNVTTVLPDVVVIGSREALARLPAAGEFLDMEDIRFHTYDNIHKVLRKSAGIYVQEENGYGLLPNISLRGVDTHRSQKITLMEDGILTAPAPYSAPSAYYSPTMGRMSGLEVLKGSSQIRYGPHTTGGAINYLSTPIPTDRTTYLKALYGMDNEFRGHLSHGGMTETGLGTLGGLAEIHHRQNDGFKTIRHASGDTDETGFHKTDYMGKLSWQPGDDRNQRVELKVGYTDFTADETYLGLSEADFADDPFQRYYATRFDNFDGYQFRSYLRHVIDLNDNLQLTSATYYNKFHRNWYKLQDIKDVAGLEPGTISQSEALASGGAALATLKGENAGTWRIRANNRDYALWGIQSRINADFEALAAEHAFEAGVRYHVDEAERYQWQDEVSVDDNGNVTGTTYGEKGGVGDRTQTARAIAGYVQDDMTWGRFSLTPGLRAEVIDNEVCDRGAGTGTLTGDEAVWAAGVSSRYVPGENWMLFAGVHRGYSVPSPADNIGKDLKEETSIAVELGSRYATKNASAEAALFYTDLNDLIVGSYVGTASDTDAENAGDINSCGIELKGEVDLGGLCEWGFKSPLWATVTYTQARLDGDAASTDPGSIFSGGADGNSVPYIPDLQAGIGYGVRFSKLECELSANYVDSTYTTANNSTEAVNPITGKPDARFGKTDSRVIVNASTRYALGRGWATFVNLHNLFDEEYVASRHPHGPRPGQPFTAMAGVEATF
jgi:Fe(3+) dicitrate transport protein